MPSRRLNAAWTATALAAALVSLGLVNTDSLWMVRLGGLVAHGHLPSSLPFATAPTAGWHDVPALAELVFWSSDSLLGERGLVLLQVLAAIVAWGLLARGLRRQRSPEGSSALVAIVVVVGSFDVLVNTRAYLFSLALYPALLYLIQEDSRRPSRRVWLCVPLLALWSNLHGAALVGWAVLLAYLALARLRQTPWTAAGVAVAATLALGLTPVLWETPDYYLGVLHNEVARRRVGLWAPIGWSGTSILLAICALALLLLAVRGRPRLWEAACLLGLAAGTVRAERVGPWLLFLASYPAARALRLGAPPPRLVLALLVALASLTLLALIVGPGDGGSRPLAREAAASGRPVLAEALLAEQVERDGGRVWVGNPIDAFHRADQRLYLDWLLGERGSGWAVAHAGLVLVNAESRPGRAAADDRRLVRLRKRGDFVLYAVRRRARLSPARRASRTRRGR
jgi:hypothetical protein